MRIYTNQLFRNIWAYTKFAATLAVLYVLISQAANLWGDEPAMEPLQNLMEKVQRK